MAVQILLFKTDIHVACAAIHYLLNSNDHVLHWSVDTDDTDCVLKIVASELIESRYFEEQLLDLGYHCELLN